MTLAVAAAATVLVSMVPARAAGSGAQVKGWLDSVTTGDDSITAVGWAADPDVPDQAAGVHIYVDGVFTTGGAASLSRPDVDKATGLGDHHGFSITFVAGQGSHRVCVYAIDRTGDPNRLLGCATVQVGVPPPAGRSPVGWLDSLAGDDDSITAVGWAADPDLADHPVGIHIYVDGVFTTGGAASLSRPDVDRATGLGANHGFRFDFTANPGRHRVCVYAIDKTGDPNRLLKCLDVTVGTTPPPSASGHKPVGWIDAMVEANGGLRIRGWALDPDTTKSVPIHVYVNGSFLTGFIANNSRPDVDGVWNLGDAHGFNEVLDIGSGWYKVCVYAIDRTGDPNSLIKCQDLILNLESDRPIERVSRFTTYFDCCLPRVTNIRLIAREVDRTVVLPGQTFSIDEVVGPRTSSGGYVPAPYLIEGEGACCAVGGGVSQFGTTIHNAVFWGGYQIDRHQPHSGWISRYPLGIEATLVYSSIDYRFTNDTDTPVIIRTSSTGTSVTVELWGNQGGWRVTGYHPRGARNSSITVLDTGGPDAKRVKGIVYGSAPGTVQVVRTLTQGGVARSQTWWWTYVS